MFDSGISEPDHDYESNMSSRSQDGNGNDNGLNSRHNNNNSNSSHHQVILEEVIEDCQPTQEELIEYARAIGIIVEAEPELMYLAREALVAPLPPDWRPIQDKSAQEETVYYFNFRTGQSSWEHPCDEHCRILVHTERLRLRAGAGAGGRKNGLRGPASAQQPPAAAATVKAASSAPNPHAAAVAPGNRVVIGSAGVGSRILLELGDSQDNEDDEDDDDDDVGDAPEEEGPRSDQRKRKKKPLSSRLSLMQTPSRLLVSNAHHPGQT